MMLSVTTAHTGDLVSVGFSLWSPEAAASEQHLWCVQVLQRKRESPRAGAPCWVSVGGQQGLCRYSLWTEWFGPHVLIVCLFIYLF